MQILKKLAERHQGFYNDLGATIVAFGDSVTQGCFECYTDRDDAIHTEFDTKECYSRKFVQILQTLYPRAQINLINSGISGDSTKKAIERIDYDVLRYQPDLVICSFGLNDVTKGYPELDGYAARLDEIFKKIKATGAECIFMTPNMINSYASRHIKNSEEAYLNLADRLAKLQNEGVMDAYMAKAKEVATANGVVVCDCYAKWKKMAENGVDTTELLANYLNHPIRDLHWLFANSLVETVFEN